MAKPKTTPKDDDTSTKDVTEKESRGREAGSPHSGRDPRPPRPDPPSTEEEKRAWKEAMNQHPGPSNVPKIRDEPPEPEPARERTPEEIHAKERRGHIQRS